MQIIRQVNRQPVRLGRGPRFIPPPPARTSPTMIYLYNNWHNGDVLTNRCLIKELLKTNLELAVGSYQNRHYLVDDLPVRHVIAPHDEDFPRSPCLSKFCPPGYTPVNTWCGTFKDLDEKPHPFGGHNWANIARTFNRQATIANIPAQVSDREPPTVDFRRPCRIRTRGRRSVYVETGPTRSGHSQFHFDMSEIGAAFPEFDFYCTSDPGYQLPNVIDCGGRDLIELSLLSNQCEVIVGKGSGPLICTLTEVNKFKPRAVVGFTAKEFWHYEGNPMQYLSGRRELMGFLEAARDDPPETL